MANIPFFYDYMNMVGSGMQPANSHVLATEIGQFYQRYLLKKAMGVFKWKLPSWWNRSYFQYVLYCWGYLAILDADQFGVIPQQCGLRGYNIFYQPTTAIITNPVIPQIIERDIGRDCVLMKLQPDYCGVLDLCAHYAEEMALASSSLETNLWNTRIASIFFAENEADAQALKKMYDKISAGEPAVVVRKNLRDDDGNLRYEIFNRDVKQSYIVSDLISDLRKIEAEFDTKVGIPNANTDKRERLITDEVNSNNVETEILAADWMDNIQRAITEVNDMFGDRLNGETITCEWRYKQNGSISDDESARTL